MQAVRLDEGRGTVGVRARGATAEILRSSLNILAERDSERGRIMVFPATPETMSLLRRCGYDVPGPDHFRGYSPPKVEGLYDPMPHQLETARFLVDNARAYVTSEMRTGKTAAVAMALHCLRHRVPGSALIVCPVSVMEGVWGRALSGADPGGGVGVLRGTAAKRRRILAEPAAYYVINYDGICVMEADLRRAIQAGRITKVVIDELSHYGNPSAQRYRAAERVFGGGPARPAFLWGLTGTPGADPLAVYGYCRMVDFQRMPWKTRAAWQLAVQYKYGNEAWMWRDRPEAPRLIRDAMQPCIRHTRAEVLEHLPPVTVSGRHAELTSLQLKAYNEMRRWLAASFGDGQVAEATQKAALLSKLFQICLGQVLTSDGGTVMIDNRYRVALIDELIRGTERKAVIFCAYRAALADLERSLKRLGHDVALVDGGVSGTRRDEIFSSFQRPDGPRVLVAHPVTTAYGTELAAADLLILNGPMMSGVHSYMQGLARLSSAKQSAGRISVIELSSSPEEREFFASLRRRTSFAQATGDLFGRIVRKEI